MNIFFRLCIFILLNLQLTAQEFSFDHNFGKFINASSFVINSSGHIYVVDSGSNEIFKLDTTGAQLQFAGGFGWDNGSFDYPVDVFATSLSVYVSDKNNHRIQRFDKDLNFISLLNTRENDNNDEQFGYPVGCVTSGQGDLFILDAENKRIIKFDLFGNFIQNFGGFDYGVYSLNKPVSMAVSSANTLFILDDSSMIIFDQFGNGIYKKKLEQPFRNIRIMFNNLTLSSKDNVYYCDLNKEELKLNKLLLPEYEGELNIVSSIFFNSRLYVLTPKQIIVFK